MTTSLPFSAEEWQPQTVADYFRIPCCGNGILQLPPHCSKPWTLPAKGYQRSVNRWGNWRCWSAKTLDQPFMLYLAIMLRICQMIILLRSNIKQLIPAVKQQIITTPFRLFGWSGCKTHSRTNWRKRTVRTIQLFSLPPIMVRLSMILCRWTGRKKGYKSDLSWRYSPQCLWWKTSTR